jgi:isopenicillin N synthase-like dioxygenase
MNNTPVIDLNNNPSPQEVVEILHKTSCLIVKDNTINFDDNEKFKNLMYDYFLQPTKELLKDTKPETGYQIGITPERMEVSKCSRDQKCLDFIKKYNLDVKVTNEKDPKWRYFWKVNETDNVIPEKFKDTWENTMNEWGNKMVNVVEKVTKLIEQGLSLEENVLLSKLKGGKHLLAPTATDLTKYNKEGTVFASFHNDISFLTIHGKSNTPGLRIWLRTGEEIKVSVPDGCLLLQVGRQLEWLTGGYFEAGFHEVISMKNNTNYKWRISSTLFTHINSEEYLEPLEQFKNNNYPRIKEEDFINEELKITNLL